MLLNLRETQEKIKEDSVVMRKESTVGKKKVNLEWKVNMINHGYVEGWGIEQRIGLILPFSASRT